MTDRHETWQLLDAIQMDLRATQGKLVELRSQIAALELPEPEPAPTCPHCGVKLSPRVTTTDQHMFIVHGIDPEKTA